MIRNILNGEPPSSVFRKIIDAEPSITTSELADILADEFGELDGEAVSLVWHWKAPGRAQGLSDENLDALLTQLFVKAGYLEAATGTEKQNSSR